MSTWEAENAKGVIVIVHGAAEHHGRYKWLIEKWRAEGYHVIMGDLPGHGETTKKERGHILDFNEYIDTVQNWYNEALQYKLPILLLGHSMGALTVIRTMQERQLNVSCLILSSPCLKLSDRMYPSSFLDGLSKIINVVIPSLRMDNGLSQDLATRNEEVLKVDREDPLFVKKVSIRWFRELVKAMDQAFIDINKLPKIPILIMQGGEDKIVNKHRSKEFFDLLPHTNKTYKEWETLYHEIFNEPERQEVFDFTKRFVETKSLPM